MVFFRCSRRTPFLGAGGVERGCVSEDDALSGLEPRPYANPITPAVVAGITGQTNRVFECLSQRGVFAFEPLDPVRRSLKACRVLVVCAANFTRSHEPKPVG